MRTLIIEGKIESIEYRNSAGHEKKVVTIVPDAKQRCFVEFRGRWMDELTAFKENDHIEVNVMLEGKIAKSTGQQYNNLVAVGIVNVKFFS